MRRRRRSGWMGAVPIPREPMPLTRNALRDDVHALLEHELVTGTLAPGARLTDDDLVQLTGTSRAPLREALNQLAAVGLVDVAPRRSTHVTELDGRASRESLQIDGAVIAQSVAEVTAAGLPGGLRETLGAARDTVLRDADAYRDAIRARRLRPLFDAVVRGTGNTEYVRLCAAVSPVVDRFAALHADTLGSTHHARMRNAVDHALAGDADAARAAWGDLVDVLLADAAVTGEADHPPRPQATTTLRSRAAEAIERAIHDGTLRPGETIRESDLMTWLGVSRTPVREALTALAVRGLVVQSHHRSARVAEMSPDGLRQVLRALGVLRRLAIRLGVEHDPDGLAAALDATLPVWAEARSLDALLHASGLVTAAIDDHCPNRRLVEHAATLTARALWYVANDPSTFGVIDPDRARRLRDAVAARDTATAEDEMWRSFVAAARRPAD